MLDHEEHDAQLEEVTESNEKVDVEEPEGVEPLTTLSEDLAGFAIAAGKAALAVGVGLGVVVITMVPTQGASHTAKIQWQDRQQQVTQILEARLHDEAKLNDTAKYQ
ncbi:MAG: hypothetical protein KC917_19895 [Candidatus Omnitrophica bacterium]|nr:hypothetical protein [Candidatus Omnitrophota bacterium]MCA9442447.1 hypothetical protein [Candidatus Omnitrophota bacterium]